MRHKSVELQKKLKHFKFWKNFYWKHDSNKFKLEGDLLMQWNNI